MGDLIYLTNNPEFNKRQEAYYLEKQCSLTRKTLPENFCGEDIEECFECPVPKYFPKAKKELTEFLLNEPYS
ncbi:MAG: hypothetical protein ACOC1P_04595 [Minisyncoccales bacterium]